MLVAEYIHPWFADIANAYSKLVFALVFTGTNIRRTSRILISTQMIIQRTAPTTILRDQTNESRGQVNYMPSMHLVLSALMIASQGREASLSNRYVQLAGIDVVPAIVMSNQEACSMLQDVVSSRLSLFVSLRDAGLVRLTYPGRANDYHQQEQKSLWKGLALRLAHAVGRERRDHALTQNRCVQVPRWDMGGVLCHSARYALIVASLRSISRHRARECNTRNQ